MEYQVRISIVEVYNERIRDLLNERSPAGGLKVRQHPKLGVQVPGGQGGRTVKMPQPAPHWHAHCHVESRGWCSSMTGRPLCTQVVGLTECAVGSYEDIDRRVEEGKTNRAIACTQNNATSSRGHLVVTVRFVKIEKDAKGPGRHLEQASSPDGAGCCHAGMPHPSLICTACSCSGNGRLATNSSMTVRPAASQASKLNFIDLAGSEVVEAGAAGDRLVEGSAINLSLTMMGTVLTTLAEKSMHPKKKIAIPYKESKLTQILQDTLGDHSLHQPTACHSRCRVPNSSQLPGAGRPAGGNSKTIMIASLSPADINFEETLQTLRYADRAKRIKNKAVVNTDPTQLLISQLKEENKKLMEQLQSMMKDGQLPSEPLDDFGESISEEEREEMRRQLQAEMVGDAATHPHSPPDRVWLRTPAAPLLLAEMMGGGAARTVN